MNINNNKISRRKIINKFGLLAGLGIVSPQLINSSIHKDDSANKIRNIESLKIAQKKSEQYKLGDIIITAGYYSAGDGGAAKYQVQKKSHTIITDGGEWIDLGSECVGKLIGVKCVNYAMFGAICNSINDDGQQLKLAHNFANKHNLPVENLTGEYWIKKTRGIEIKTSVKWGSSTFHIDERFNTSNSTFLILSYQKPVKIQTDDRTKKSIINRIRPGVQEIPELKEYTNSLINIKDRNDRIGIRAGASYKGKQTKPKEELFFLEENGRISGDIAWVFQNYTELIAYPGEISYLIIEGGSFYLSGDHYPKNYLKNGFSIRRSRTIVKNQWVGLEPGATDTALKARSGFFDLNTVYDVLLQNIRLLPWEKSNRPNNRSDVPAGTYGISGRQTLFTTFKNITAEGTQMHWGVFGTNLNKNFRIEKCKLNRVDVHFHCWNLSIKDSYIGYKGITVTGGGDLFIENTSCQNNHFVNFRYDFGAKWDGSIYITNCRLQPNKPSETSILNFHAANFDYGYPIGLAKSIFVQNFTVDFRTIPDYQYNSWLIKASIFSSSKSGRRSFFPKSVSFINILTEGRQKGLRLIDIPDLQGYSLSQEGSYDSRFLDTNSLIIFDNIDLEKFEGEESDCFHLRLKSDLKKQYDEFSLYPKIQISNCDSVAIDLQNVHLCLYIENSTVCRFSSNNESMIPGEYLFFNCKFRPVLCEKRTNPLNISAELGVSFINCIFHLPLLHGEMKPKYFKLIDFIEINKRVKYNHLNSRLGKDVIKYYQSIDTAFNEPFIQKLKNHHELEDV